MGDRALDARLIYLYRNELSELAYYAVQLIDHSRIDSKISGLQDEVLIEKNELNTDFKNYGLDCFSKFLDSKQIGQRLRTITAQYQFSYALLLIHSPAAASSPDEGERKKRLHQAQVMLENVVTVYGENVREELDGTTATDVRQAFAVSNPPNPSLPLRSVLGIDHRPYPERLFHPSVYAADLAWAERELRSFSKTPE
jgi:hypothetical protein